MRNRFRYQWSERRIQWIEGSDDYTENDDYDPDCFSPTDLRGALEEMANECWDTIDLRDDSIICYPADSRTDMRTGEDISNTLFIKGDPGNLERLVQTHNSLWER